MRIGIDARFVGPQGTGIGVYTKYLINNLQKIDIKNEYVIFLKDDNWNEINLQNKNFTKVLADVSWYSLAEQIKLGGIFKKQNLDLLHVPHFNVPLLYNKNFVVTIHDLIHHDFKENSATTKNTFTHKIKQFAYEKNIKHAITKSKKIITPSEFVKKEVIKRYKVSPQKIAVTYEAAEEEYQKISNLKSQISNSAKKKSFLLYVGNAYPHKNLNRLLDAMQLLSTVNRQPSTPNLLIVSPRDAFSQRLDSEIKLRNLKKFVEVRGYIKTQDLVQVYKGAKAYVCPSLSEGFGIPGLNAMAAGVPLISSNIPTLKEIYGTAAVYFDPNDPKDIAEKIKKVISSDKLSKDLVEKGREQAKKYSWQKMARETLRAYTGIK